MKVLRPITFKDYNTSQEIQKSIKILRSKMIKAILLFKKFKNPIFETKNL